MKLGREPISDQTGEAIRAEFTLPSLGQVRRRLSELMEDPEPVMQPSGTGRLRAGKRPAPQAVSPAAALVVVRGS